jgi:hypothetical protein
MGRTITEHRTHRIIPFISYGRSPEDKFLFQASDQVLVSFSLQYTRIFLNFTCNNFYTRDQFILRKFLKIMYGLYTKIYWLLIVSIGNWGEFMKIPYSDKWGYYPYTEAVERSPMGRPGVWRTRKCIGGKLNINRKWEASRVFIPVIHEASSRSQHWFPANLPLKCILSGATNRINDYFV